MLPSTKQANVKHTAFVKLDIIYGEYLPENCNYFGIPIGLKKSIYGMNDSGKLFADDLTNWQIDLSGFK